jgi:hypothetical protein
MEENEVQRAVACEGKRVEARERVTVVADGNVPVSLAIEHLLAELRKNTKWQT